MSVTVVSIPSSGYLAHMYSILQVEASLKVYMLSICPMRVASEESC